MCEMTPSWVGRARQRRINVSPASRALGPQVRGETPRLPKGVGRKHLWYTRFSIWGLAADACGLTESNFSEGVEMAAQEVLMPDGTRFEFWDDQTEYTRVYHVACNHPGASDDNPGTEDKPFASIGRADRVGN